MKKTKKKSETRSQKPFPCPYTWFGPIDRQHPIPAYQGGGSCMSAGPQSCSGVLVAQDERGKPIDMEREGAFQWACSKGCGFVVLDENRETGEDRCPSDGAPVRFDPTIKGHTAGGLLLRGWNVCDHCGGVWITRKAIPGDGGTGDGSWRLALGGRSLDAGQYRLRVDGKGKRRGKVADAAGDESAADDTVTLMARIARMPAFEAALEKIARGELNADQMRALANEALSMADNIDQVD